MSSGERSSSPSELADQSDRHVIVVGGGIAGLAAAHALVTADRPPRVTLIEGDERVGGKVRSSPFAGLDAVDEGADAFLARVPWATDLARSVGLGDALVSPVSGSASVWWHGLRPIPEGLLLGMPTDVMKLARTRLLTWPAKARAAIEPFLRRTDTSADSIGAYVRARFGDQVHERLVDPLVGSIYAADTDRYSLAAVAQIADLAAKHRSVLLAARRRPAAPSGPVFYAPRGGVAALAAATADAIRHAGGTVRTGTPVESIVTDGVSWRVDDEHADAVILACPAVVAGRLLRDDRFSAITYADVAMVTIAIDGRDWPDRLHGQSGYLVPKPVQQLVTAASFGSQKWAHWDDGSSVILRVSLGRDGLPVLHLDDDELLAAATREVGEHLGLSIEPSASRITRWTRAFPQYRPNHHVVVDQLASSLPASLALAGASYHGIGIPACVRSGREAAAAILRLARVG